MPNLTREESDERERFVIDSWKNAIRVANGANVPASVINALIMKRYHQNMRGDKVYRLRTDAIQELRSAGINVPEPKRKGDPRSLPQTAAPPTASGTPPPPVMTPAPSNVRRRGRPPGSKNRPASGPPRAAPAPTRGWGKEAKEFPLPHLIQLGQLPPADAVGHVLNVLRDAGLINIQVEVSAPSYVVVNTTR